MVNACLKRSRLFTLKAVTENFPPISDTTARHTITNLLVSEDKGILAHAALRCKRKGEKKRKRGGSKKILRNNRPFLKPKIPVFGPSGNQSVSTLETILLCVFFLITCQYPVFSCTRRAASFY